MFTFFSAASFLSPQHNRTFLNQIERESSMNRTGIERNRFTFDSCLICVRFTLDSRSIFEICLRYGGSTLLKNVNTKKAIYYFFLKALFFVVMESPSIYILLWIIAVNVLKWGNRKGFVICILCTHLWSNYWGSGDFNVPYNFWHNGIYPFRNHFKK